MRDYLTLSWARFSKDVQSHTLQIAKILEAPSPRAGDIVRLDAGASGEHLEVVCRFPGGLDFGRGLVDVNVSRTGSGFIQISLTKAVFFSASLRCGQFSGVLIWIIS